MSLRESDELVSVIVPAYNAERFIRKTLLSIAAQTHRRLEIVVVDDGSTDGTAGIVAALASEDDRIRLFSGTRRGVPASRNFAAAQASGAYLAPCDSDDLWRSDKIARQLAALQAASVATGAVNCWSAGINEDDEIVFPDWARSPAAGNVLHAMIENSLPGSGSAPLIRRGCFDAAGGYPEYIPNGDEWQLYIALAGICEFALVPEVLVGYRLRKGSISNDFREVEESLGRTTKWIGKTWPDTPADVMARRASIVNCYLSFLTARNGRFWLAIRYRFLAWMARPADILGLTTLGFALMLFGQLLGLQRYYFAFWNPPEKWSGVAALPTPGDAPA